MMPRASVERALAIFLPRSILGFVYFFAGVHKIVDVGPFAYAQAMAMSDGSRFVPIAVLSLVGTAVPFIELLLGLLVLLGLWTRHALRLLAILIALITVGYGISGLLHPMGATAMNVTVVNTFILPRAALVMLLLMLPAEGDLLSLDHLRVARSVPPGSRESRHPVG